MSHLISALSVCGRTAALLTKHQKLGLIEPAVLPLGLRIEVAEGYDTDTLGTFSGEVERTLSPIDCARRKAQLACELTGLDLGLGSEGSFGGGPMPGLVNWDTEILVLYDQVSQLEVVAWVSGPVKLTKFEFSSLEQLKQHLGNFAPEQGWIMRWAGGLVKGLQGFEQIAAQLSDNGLIQGKAAPVTGVTIEPDLRAMHCPERQAYIRQAAEQLAQRLQSLCPECAAPNFWTDTVERGLPCRWCATPSELPNVFIKRCHACQHELREPNPLQFAEPAQCQWCNP